MKRLVLLVIFGTILASKAALFVHLAPADAVTIGPRHGHRPPKGDHTPSFDNDNDNDNDDHDDDFTTVRGLPMATIPRARDSAREALGQTLADFLRPAGLPAHWQPPADILDRLIQWGPVETTEHDYGTVYVQEIRLDTSVSARRQLVEAFSRQEAGRRLVHLGGLLGFILTCLAALTSYIHTDEATRGYYTNQLRLAALTSVSLTGYLLYRFLS